MRWRWRELYTHFRTPVTWQTSLHVTSVRWRCKLADAVQENGRLGYLDSIRGIAALIVVLGHCCSAFSFFEEHHVSLAQSFESVSQFSSYWLQEILSVTRSSVMMFFVLSGFVLAYSSLKQQTSYAGYAIKRVFRIYPAFLFVIILSYALHRLIGVPHDAGSHEWLEHIINPDLSFSVLMKNLAMFGDKSSFMLDSVTWSLVHEMRISLIFPFILLSVQKYRWRGILVYSLVSALCALWYVDATGHIIRGYFEETIPQTFVATSYFVVFFAGGAFLAIERQRVAQRVAGLPKGIQIFLFATVTGLLLKADYTENTFQTNIVDYMRGLGSLGLIALVMGQRALGKALSHAALIWLGRISYSLYLVHFPVLYVVNQTIGKSWSVVPTAAAVTGLSLMAADLMVRIIESPSIRLGKKLCEQQLEVIQCITNSSPK